MGAPAMLTKRSARRYVVSSYVVAALSLTYLKEKYRVSLKMNLVALHINEHFSRGHIIFPFNDSICTVLWVECCLVAANVGCGYDDGAVRGSSGRCIQIQPSHSKKHTTPNSGYGGGGCPSRNIEYRFGDISPPSLPVHYSRIIGISFRFFMIRSHQIESKK